MTKQTKKSKRNKQTVATHIDTTIETTSTPETIGELVSHIEIKNPVVKKMWQALRFMFIAIAWPFKFIGKLLLLPIKGVKNANKMLQSDPKTRHMQEVLIWLISIIATAFVIVFEHTVVSLFIFDGLTNAANASNNIDANYYVKQVDSLNMINSILIAAFIIYIVTRFVKRFKSFRQTTELLKQSKSSKNP